MHVHIILHNIQSFIHVIKTYLM